MQQTTIQVIGMACGSCVNRVEKTLKVIGASGKVNLKQGSVVVDYDENQLSLETIKNAIEDLGYDIS